MVFYFNNEEHQEFLEELYERSKSSDYNGAIYVLTVKDPEKRKTLIENLNYKIFYKESEFDEWISTLKKI